MRYYTYNSGVSNLLSPAHAQEAMPTFYCALQGTILILQKQSQRYQLYQYHAHLYQVFFTVYHYV